MGTRAEKGLGKVHRINQLKLTEVGSSSRYFDLETRIDPPHLEYKKMPLWRMDDE